jgi:2-polyprenyl-6-methoxyphenol hydroxylase-like FAD-dependent oxidoreductase
MKALIAGAGIAGLASGIALRQVGMEIEIFERASKLHEIGAGLMIWPNGSGALAALGVEIDALPVRHLSICTWRGRRLSQYAVGEIGLRFGYEPCFVHRADLQEALGRRLGRDDIHLASEVDRFRQNGTQIELVLRDGATATGDILIGADGLRSVVRRQLLSDGDPRYLGSTVWRGIASGDRMLIRPETGINWIGRGAEFLAFHLKGNQIYWAGVSKEPAGERPGSGGHKADVISRFKTWAAPVYDLIVATDEDAILRNDMYDRPPASNWTAGRVALVGDAAHPMTPNAGQGACQALQDAVALGTGFAATSNPTAAFSDYERRRRKRANNVVAMSHRATRAVQIENRFLSALRDFLGYRVAEWMFLRALGGILRP